MPRETLCWAIVVPFGKVTADEDAMEGSLKSFQAAHPGMVQFGNPTGTHIRQSDRNFVAYIRCSFATTANHCVDGFVERCSK